MTLQLINNTTKAEYVVSGLEDINNSRLYWTFHISLPDGMDDGEYNYVLLDNNNKPVCNGLLQVGDYKPSVSTYNKQTTYIQYGG